MPWLEKQTITRHLSFHCMIYVYVYCNWKFNKPSDTKGHRDTKPNMHKTKQNNNNNNMMRQFCSLSKNSVINKGVDNEKVYFVLDPTKDLDATTIDLFKKFKKYNGWKGVIRKEPTCQELKDKVDSWRWRLTIWAEEMLCKGNKDSHLEHVCPKMFHGGKDFSDLSIKIEDLKFKVALSNAKSEKNKLPEIIISLGTFDSIESKSI